jgi:hypothetical protein
MMTYVGCRAEGEACREDPGPHDGTDLLAYWLTTPTYPIANKCRTSEDVDGDGICDRFGPPVSPEGPASREAGAIGSRRRKRPRSWRTSTPLGSNHSLNPVRGRDTFVGCSRKDATEGPVPHKSRGNQAATKRR